MFTYNRKKIRFILFAAILCAACFALSGCIPGDGANSVFRPAGFFTGIWHGWIAPVSLIASIFNKSFSIYEVNNTGFFYNLGYYAAIIGGFGCITITRRKRAGNTKNT